MKYQAFSGLKFGCDYLLHPISEQAEKKKHSKYCAYFTSDKPSVHTKRSISGCDIVGMCRAANGVHKSVLIAASEAVERQENTDGPSVMSIDEGQCIVLSWVRNPFKTE